MQEYILELSCFVCKPGRGFLQGHQIPLCDIYTPLASLHATNSRENHTLFFWLHDTTSNEDLHVAQPPISLEAYFEGRCTPRARHIQAKWPKEFSQKSTVRLCIFLQPFFFSLFYFKVFVSFFANIVHSLARAWIFTMQVSITLLVPPNRAAKSCVGAFRQL